MTSPPIPAGVDRRPVIWPNARLILSAVDSTATSVPQKGRVTIQAAVKNVTVRSVTPSLTLSTQVETVALDADGVMRATLVCTDDPDISPNNGWTYTFRGDWAGSPTITCPVPMVPVDPVTGQMPALDLSEMVSVPIVDGVMVTKGDDGTGVAGVALSDDGTALVITLTNSVVLEVPIPALASIVDAQDFAAIAGAAATVATQKAEDAAGSAAEAASYVGSVLDGAITTAKLADGAVVWAKLAQAVRDVIDGKAPVVHTHPAADIDGSSEFGRSVLGAADAPAVRDLLGVDALTLGTTAGTAKPGDWKPAAGDISDSTTLGRDLLRAVTAQAVRDLLGAGTSSLTIGTTATTAMAGNRIQQVSALPATPTAGVLYLLPKT